MKSTSDCVFSLMSASYEVGMFFSNFSCSETGTTGKTGLVIKSLFLFMKPDKSFLFTFVQVVGPKGPPGPMVNIIQFY